MSLYLLVQASDRHSGITKPGNKVKIVNNDTFFHTHTHLIILLSCIAVLFSLAIPGNAQENKNKIELWFVKSSDSLKTTDLYFNVLKICNNSSEPVSGSVSFSGPENWKIISFPMIQTSLSQGDTVSVPVRVSPSSDAIGGITYVLSASFRTRDKQITGNTYLTLPQKVKWDFSTNKSSIYFTEQSFNSVFQVSLSNKGNTNELIRLHFQIGKLLMFPNINDIEYTEFVELPAFKDTIISYPVTYRNQLSYVEKTRYENNWKESAITVTASAETTEKSATIMIRKLSSSFFNKRDQNSSPLNFDYQVYNLMSNQKARYNVKLYGTILFSKSRDIQYSAGLNNIYYASGSNKNFDLNHQFLYSLRYIDKKNDILIGYNIHGGELHTINGRGITGSYEINEKSKISYALTQNPYSQIVGEYLGYTSIIKKISLNSGVIHESSSIDTYAATSVLFGSGFTFLKYHSLSLEALGSKVRYNNLPDKDTTVLGFSYKLTYTMRYKKFEMRVHELNSTRNFIRNSGRQQIYLDSRYSLNDKIKIQLYGNRDYYSITSFPYNFYNPANYNSNDYLRLTTSFSRGNVIYQAGPNYNGSMRQYNDPVTKFKSEYKTYQPGIWGATTFKLNGYRSITPNITISNLRFNYTNEDPSSGGYSFKKNIYYSAGINYYDNAWKVNAYYSSGSTSDLYRSVQIYEQPVLSRSIQVRPSYEKYFFDRKVKLSAYANYSYYMPSGRENILYNARYDHYLKNGWVIYVSGFMYSNTRVDKELGRNNMKDINIIAGITKSFEMQQPRLKYYDFKAVFFNDLDGNMVKSKNEPPVSNIKVNIGKDQSVPDIQSNIAQMDMISDVNGEIFFENLPRDFYKLTFTPLVNLQSLYFLNGSEQTYYNDQDRILYIPLAESYKIKGKIVLIRDPNSSDGKIAMSGIRVTATGKKGETYSALTDNFGAYVLKVPSADNFKVHVNNIFGENFNIDTGESEVQFTQNKTINLDFTFIEKRRDVKFNNGDEFFKFKSIKNDSIP